MNSYWYNSEAAYGGIYAKTDKSFYFAGDTVTGVVYLNLMQPYPGTYIYLRLVGSETCEFSTYRTVHEGHGQHQRTRQVEVHHHGGHKFYDIQIPLYTMPGGGMNMGQYSFPFQFQVAPTLPGTFYEQGHKWMGTIRYTLEVELASNVGGVPNIDTTRQFVIREKLKKGTYPTQGSMECNVTNMCCIGKGKASIVASFDKQAYVPGETAVIVTSIDNRQCQVAVNSVDAKFRKHVTLRANDGKIKNIQELVTQVSVPGCQPGQTIPPVRTDLRLVDTIGVIKPVQPSTRSHYVRCEYILTSQANMDSCCSCEGDPNVKNYIQIYAPEIVYGQFQTPQGWNPTAMPMQQLQFGQPNMIQGGGMQVNNQMRQMNNQQQMGMGQQQQQMGMGQQQQQMGMGQQQQMGMGQQQQMGMGQQQMGMQQQQMGIQQQQRF